MEKRKVGRPKKTSKPVVEQVEVITWKQKYHDLLKEHQLREETSETFMADARDIISQQAENQLDLVKLVLDSYSTMEHHCTEVSELTGHIEQSDILYLTGVARRALLHKFVQFNKTIED
jgi:hypothetical protein